MDSDTLAKLILIPLASLVFLTLIALGILVVRDTIRQRGNFGINTKQVYCPDCDEPAPTIRAPKNLRQAVWGGCTCAECGTEYDKWGRRVKKKVKRNDDA